MSLTIAYYPASNGGLSFRGSEISMHDYALFAQQLLGHKSVICLREGAYNEPLVLEKFKKSFNTFIWFKNTSDLEQQLIAHKVDAFYTIRSGKKEEPMLLTIPMLTHCVYDMSEQHGIAFAGVSESVAKRCGRTEFVPHMVHINDTLDNYRAELGIPTDAKVFGRHGGIDTWDLSIAKQAVLKVLNDRSDIYFLFAVRPQILHDVSHPRLICLEVFADPVIKRKFINTCDAMIHAQSLGETFGLSIAEFNAAGKPVITFNGGSCQEHLRILGDKCIKYNNADDLFVILTAFDPSLYKKINWKAYEDYTPEKVMKVFDQVFLVPLRKHIAINQSKDLAK